MAPTANQIADEYRRLQSQLSGEAAAQVTVAYETLLNPRDLDRTFPLYAEVVAQIIESARRSAAVLAGAFYVAHREASRVLDEVPPIAYAGQLPAEQLSTSLLVTGPVRVKYLTAHGSSPAQAAAGGRAATARAAVRHVTDAGRDTIRDTTRRDPVALGFARLTDGDPCYFCAMLASRGPVYESAETAGADDPYHDGCGCVPAPVYRRSDPWPGRAREFEALWKDATAGKSGRAAINAFRRAFDGQKAEAAGTPRRARTVQPAKRREPDRALLAEAQEIDRRAAAAKKAGNDAEAARLYAEAAAVRRRAYGTG